MISLTLNLEQEIGLLKRYSLTADELLFVRAILILQEEQNEDLLISYIEHLHYLNIGLGDMLRSLQEKRIILKEYKIPENGQSFDPYSIPFNKSVIKTLFTGSLELGKELFECYPSFGTVGGCTVGLRSVSKNFNTLEDAFTKYGKEINWSLERHKEILNLLEWAKEQGNLINYTLSSFIISHRWLELQELRDGNIGNINYDTIKLV